MSGELNHNPDVLNCLANLSNDEVFTPPEIANAVLDMLPKDLWSNPKTKILDPATKTGVFLREAAKRLIVGLEKEIPDLQHRIDHIMHNQLFGYAITELTSHLSRRSLYCSKNANGPYSISKFKTAQGNILYEEIEHSWKNGKCELCGASKKEFDNSEKEKHAYSFIHMDKKTEKELTDMKFDLIISNPPYQLSDGGNGSSAMPIYNQFVEQAKKLNPRYLSMIIPSRWFAGGKGLDDFRKSMLEDRRLVKMVDYVNAKDCFQGISLGGGVNYFLWDRDHPGQCEFTNIHDGKASVQMRDMNEFSVFVRYNEAISIIHKVLKRKEPLVSNIVGSRNPFGFPSSARGKDNSKLELKIYSSAGTGYVSRNDVKIGNSDIDKYKVMISKVTSEHAGEPDKSGMFKVISRAEILPPKSVCTDSYLIAFSDVDGEKVKNFYSYLCTKFFRFLLLQAVSSINLSKDKFCFIPLQNFTNASDINWALSIPEIDEQLYKKYNLTEEEISFIESMVKPMDLSEGGSNE